MNLGQAKELPKGGFNFENCKRNALLIKNGFKPPKAVKTGTTIVGVVFKNGVVLGADTRATEESTVADKNCIKIHYLIDNMYCCGAGTAADTMMTTKLISSQLEMLELNTGREVPVRAACILLKQMLFRYQGYVSAALVLGGVDKSGPHVYAIYPHGSTDKLPYVTMGSGSLAAMSIFEQMWEPDMSEEDAKHLVVKAVTAGIFNDLGSGSYVDLCVIRRNEVDYLRNHSHVCVKSDKELDYTYEIGTTKVLKSMITNFHIMEEVVPMDIN